MIKMKKYDANNINSKNPIAAITGVQAKIPLILDEQGAQQNSQEKIFFEEDIDEINMIDSYYSAVRSFYPAKKKVVL